MPIERRIISRGTSVRAMTDPDGSLSISGIAAPFNRYAQMKNFRERILPGAFKKVLARSAQARSGGTDVACLLNHDPNFVLGKMSNRTLTVEEVSSGLAFRCQLPDTTYARDLHALIQRRDISGCSFGFGCNPDGSDEVWDQSDEEDEDEDGTRSRRSTKFVRRTIRNFSMLADVSPCTYPAYTTGTSVEARSVTDAIPEGCPAEYRSLILALRGEDVDRANFAKRRRDLMNMVIS